MRSSQPRQEAGGRLPGVLRYLFYLLISFSKDPVASIFKILNEFSPHYQYNIIHLLKFDAIFWIK